MRHKRIIVLALAAVLGLADIIYAAEPGDESISRLPPATLQGASNFTLGTAVQIDASTKNSRASLQFSNQLSNGSDGGRFSDWSVTVSAPLNGDQSQSEIATLDGLANASKLTLAYNNFHANRVKPSMEAQTKLLDECNRLLTGGEECTLENVRKRDPNALPEVNLRFWGNRPRYLWGVSATAGYESFDYLDQNNLEKRDTKKAPWGIGGYVGIVPAEMAAVVTIGVEYQDAYKAQSEKLFCPSNSGAGPAFCQSGKIGEPKKLEKQLIYAEGRALLPGSKSIVGKEMAVSLRITHDFKADSWGFDLPIYLLADSAGKLTGGVRFGWNSQDNKGEVGIFFGGSFSIF